ncbi:MAG: hypothetical protein FWC42_09815 [Proteobacteria bacterium]|nr:hypothetical protein [Pseudomonadota bacterium]
MKSHIIIIATLVIFAHVTYAQEANSGSQPVSFSGTSKATEVDPQFRQRVVNWMAAEVERKTGCKLKSIEASSPPYVEQWAGEKPAHAARREVEIWRVTYCQRAANMMVHFDFTEKNVTFGAEQMGASESLSPPQPGAGAIK